MTGSGERRSLCCAVFLGHDTVDDSRLVHRLRDYWDMLGRLLPDNPACRVEPVRMKPPWLLIANKRPPSVSAYPSVDTCMQSRP